MSKTTALRFCLLLTMGVTVSFYLYGQAAGDCTSMRNTRAPKYRIVTKDYTREDVPMLTLRISVAAKHFSRDELVALACRLDSDFAGERRLFVLIFDNPRSARNYVPPFAMADPPGSLKDQHSQRAFFLRDPVAQKHFLSWFPDPNDRKNEVMIRLSEAGRK